MNGLYFDCFSGVSGDMILGAMLDIGWPKKELLNVPTTLKLKDVSIEISRVTRSGISANMVQIISHEDQQPRRLNDLLELIEKSNLNITIKQKAQNILYVLGRAEAKIHSIPLEQVHFHEIGAIDTIVDIVGCLMALDFLKIDKVHSSLLPLARGFVKSMHGNLPLPAPATLEILKDIPVEFIDEKHELVTPTGAALLKNIVDEWKEPGRILLSKIGYGAGSRDSDKRPNILRLILYKKNNKTTEDDIIEIKTVIDDMQPEHLGYLYEILFENGAVDFWICPIYMKKNRPGFELTVLCPEDKLQHIQQLIFNHTTTIGIRLYRPKRQVLKRKKVLLRTSIGEIFVKEILRPGGKREIVPEYDQCVKLAQKLNMPLRYVYEEIKLSASKKIKKESEKE